VKFDLGGVITQVMNVEVGIRVRVFWGKLKGVAHQLLEFATNTRNPMVTHVGRGHFLRTSGATRQPRTPASRGQNFAATDVPARGHKAQNVIMKRFSDFHLICFPRTVGTLIFVLFCHEGKITH